MSLSINQPHGWIFLVLLALGVLSVALFYRRVPPTVGRGLRVALAALRAVALSLLFLALIEPVLALTRSATQRPIVAVLLDSSRSMAIPDGTNGARRGDEAVSLLNEIVLPRVAREADVRAFSFSGDVEELGTDGKAIEAVPPLDGEATDIGGALSHIADELKGENLGAVVLATDGASNRGASPYDAAIALGAPVYVLGVSSAGFGGSETVVELAEDGVVLDSERIRLSGTGEETELTFRVVPSTPGVHRYTISVPPAAGELTTANNVRVAVTTAFKGKIRVLLVAPRPSWDFAFLAREFEADGNMDLTAIAVKTGAPASPDVGLPRSREELFAFDLVVLVETSMSAPKVPAEWLAGFVRDRGGGLLIVGPPGGGVPADDLAAVIPVIVRGQGAAGRETRSALTEAGEADVVTRVVSDRFANAEAWRLLPPIWTADEAWWHARPEARTLVTGRGADGAEVPTVVVGRAGAGNTMAVLARGLWRWKMAGPDDVDVYERFLANAARWLTARGELERVVVSTDRDVYAAGETVLLSGQVYREDFRLAGDATVTVSVSRGEGAAPVASVVLEPDGEFYRGEIGRLAPGRYIFEAAAERAGEELGTADGEFVVEEFSLEDSEVRRRPALLTRLAEDSGGGYFCPETTEDVPESVPLEWVRRVSSREFEIWNSPWLLVGFVGLLSIEWTLRRRKGLP